MPFGVRLTGGTARQSLMPAYDGFNSLAGFSLSLALVTNYVQTGRIRHRGDFPGRDAVLAKPLVPGSVVSDFIVQLGRVAFGFGDGLTDTQAREFLVDVFKRTIDRNLGLDPEPSTDELSQLESSREGDLEALAAAIEPAVRQSHAVIGPRANVINVFGGSRKIATYDDETKRYVSSWVEDKTIRRKDFSVASFNVNTGYGGVYDRDLRRVMPIKVSDETLPSAKAVLTWGIDQYARGTNKYVDLTYWTLNALDGRPKRYMVIDAVIPGL